MKPMFDVRKRFGAGMLLLSMAVLAACAGGAPPVLPAAGATPAAPASGTASIEVQLDEYTISMPASIPAGRIAFEVSNVGTTTHGFRIEGRGIDAGLEQNLAPGETATLEVDLVAGTYQAFCPVDAHKGRGMMAELTVTAP